MKKFALSIFLIIGVSEYSYSSNLLPSNLPESSSNQQRPNFSPPPEPSNKVFNFIVGFINDLGTNIKLQQLNERKNVNNENPKVAQVSPNEMVSSIKDQANKVVESEAKKNYYFNKMQNINFDLDLEFWNNKETAKDNIKYDLIIKEVVLPIESNNLYASLDNDIYSSKRSKMEVRYTIGPIEPELPLVRFSTPPEYEEDKFIKFKSKIPRAKFKTKVTPLFGNPSSQSSKADYKVNIRQEEDYYEFIYEPRDGKKVAEHQLNVPIYDKLKYGQRYNSKGKLIKMSFNNVLMSDKTPIDLSYLNAENKYQSELRRSSSDYELGMQIQVEPINSSREYRYNKPRYTLTYKSIF